MCAIILETLISYSISFDIIFLLFSLFFFFMMTFSLYEYKVHQCLLEKIFSKEKGDFGHKKEKKRENISSKK
jgi:hypothetical protein